MRNFFQRPSVRRIRQALSATAALACLGVSGCAVVGPASIDSGRLSYNRVIHDTAKEQTLLNIVRVANHESPLFLDVTEVDAATTLQGTISGGPSGIGSLANLKSTTAGTIQGAVGFITGGAAYSEAPTVRYQPLSGQPLIAQLSTPMTPEVIANSLDSDWPLATVLTLGVSRLTPGAQDNTAAANALIDLDQYGAVVFAATASPEKEKPGGEHYLVKSPLPKNNLTIFFKPEKVINHAQCDLQSDPQTIVNALWNRLKALYGFKKEEKVNAISVSGAGSFDEMKPDKAKAPVLILRSAFDIMRHLAERDSGISHAVFTSDVETIRRYISQRKALKNCRDDFYTTLWSSKDDWDKYEYAIADRIGRGDISMATMFAANSRLGTEEARIESRLSGSRMFLLVAQTDTPPKDADVSVSYNGSWYSILDDDDISKKSLALIAQFNTVLAVASPSPSLTPTISVGARP